MSNTTIKRAPRDKLHPFLITPRAFAEDMNISMELKALLLYCFSRPDNWEYHVTHLATVHHISTKKCLKLIREGIDAGYIKRENKRIGNLVQGVIYLFSEEKEFSNNFTDTDESSTSNEIFEKEVISETKPVFSKNVTDSDVFGHAEKDPLINNDRTRINNERSYDKRSERSYSTYEERQTKIPHELRNLGLTEKDERIFAKKIREGKYEQHHMNLAIEDMKTYKGVIHNKGAFLTERIEGYTNFSKKIGK